MATRAFPGERFGLKLPALASAAGRASEAVGPPELCEVSRARNLVRKATIEVRPRHWAVNFPATFHENIIGTKTLAINRILRAGHHGWGHRNQREEPSRYNVQLLEVVAEATVQPLNRFNVLALNRFDVRAHWLAARRRLQLSMQR